MKVFIFILILLSFVIISSLYIAEEDNSLEIELKLIKHKDIKPLIAFHEKFAAIDMKSKELDLNKIIFEIKQARKIYPLDDKLKMLDIELEHRRANESY